MWTIDQPRAAAGQPPARARLHFIWGRGGSGKTFLDKALLDYARTGGVDRRQDGRVALALASSGIAALLLDGGRTVHSRLKIPIDLTDPTTRSSITAQSELAALLRETSLILWDEATMLSVKVLRVVDELLRDVMRNDLPMGGKFVVPPSSPPPRHLRPRARRRRLRQQKAKYEPARRF